MSESLERIEKFLATRRTMRGIDQVEIAQLNVGGADEARLLTADLEQLVKLAALASQANLAITQHKTSDFNSDHPALAAYQRSYADAAAE